MQLLEGRQRLDRNLLISSIATGQRQRGIPGFGIPRAVRSPIRAGPPARGGAVKYARAGGRWAAANPDREGFRRQARPALPELKASLDIDDVPGLVEVAAADGVRDPARDAGLAHHDG
jgi:hypothetical protein